MEEKEQGYISLLSDDEDLAPPLKLPRTISSGVSSLGGSQESLGAPKETLGVRFDPLSKPRETPGVCLEPSNEAPEPLGPAEEKARRKAVLANLKSMKPGECMKVILCDYVVMNTTSDRTQGSCFGVYWFDCLSNPITRHVKENKGNLKMDTHNLKNKAIAIGDCMKAIVMSDSKASVFIIILNIKLSWKKIKRFG